LTRAITTTTTTTTIPTRQNSSAAEIIPAVHIHLEGYTAFFRIVWSISGTQLTVPCPPYSTLLGLISCCAGKIVIPADTRIGYEFTSVSENIELERTDRFEFKDNKLRTHPEGKYIVKRKVLFKPKLDLYVTNTSLADVFRHPVGTPKLGRSQDLCWITKVEPVTLTPVQSGNIGKTMIRSDSLERYVSAELISCVEAFDNFEAGKLRKVHSKSLFQIIQPRQRFGFKTNHRNRNSNGQGTRINITGRNLYHPSNLPTEDVIYLHEWSTVTN
jgi:CRISPR-associated protein Cas5t